MSRHYGQDLAHVHDVGFGDFARHAIPGLLATLQKADLTSGRVVDVGCGSGILAGALVRRGFEVLGVDCSQAMLALARENAPGAKYKRGSYGDVALPHCDAILAIGEVLSYIGDRQRSDAPLWRFFRRAHEALSVDGLLIFDVVTPGRTRARPRRERNYDADDWAVISHARETGRELVREIVTFRRVGKLYRRTDEVHRLRLYDSTDLANRLRRIGFTVQVRRRYGEMVLPKGNVAFIARKRRGRQR